MNLYIPLYYFYHSAPEKGEKKPTSLFIGNSDVSHKSGKCCLQLCYSNNLKCNIYTIYFGFFFGFIPERSGKVCYQDLLQSRAGKKSCRESKWGPECYSITNDKILLKTINDKCICWMQLLVLLVFKYIFLDTPRRDMVRHSQRGRRGEAAL